VGVDYSVRFARFGGELPVPPVPPPHFAIYDNAPLPDLQAREPLLLPAEAPSLHMRLYHARSYDMSQGFPPGSRYRSTEDRKVTLAPGLSLTVPLR
jgi:hypothetical protein